MRAFVIAAALATAGFGVSAQESRELGAHEHGHGRLDIAVEGASVAMALEAPGFDIVGFEHEARSGEDRAAVGEAVAQLARPGDLFRFPDPAACTVTEAAVELIGGESPAGEAHAEERSGEGHAEHADAGEHEAQARHAEFHATYSVTCDDPDALDRIEFTYFEVFPNAEELEVQMVTDKGATVMEIGRDAPALDLAGRM